MTNLVDNLTLGIIGGLVATLLVVIFAKFWKKLIIPWFEKRIYKDAVIEGLWDSEYQDNLCGNEIVTIKQSSHRVTGTMVTLNGANTGNVYNFKGLFKNLILTASYTSNAKGALDRGTITLMLVNNGSTLKGYCSFYEDTSSQVISTEYVLNRNTGET